jgi:hypothetical protein
MHSKQLSRLYICVTTYANLSAAALALGLTTFTSKPATAAHDPGFLLRTRQYLQ